MAYEPTEWADGADGGTPITAEALNNIEQGVASAQNPAPVTWGTLGDKPATFPPEIGTTAATALAGNTALLKLGTTAATALAGNTPILSLGTSATTAAKGDHVHTIANVTGLQTALDAKATTAALAALEARVAALEAP